MVFDKAKQARFTDARESGKECYLLYMGDHDPSGEDMVRDIRKRLEDFGLSDLDVRKVGLTMEQVREHNLPPNPAKMSDPRASGYVERHGCESWELDALPPDVLHQLVRDAILELMDLNLYKKVVEQEEADKERLRSMLEGQA